MSGHAPSSTPALTAVLTAPQQLTTQLETWLEPALWLSMTIVTLASLAISLVLSSKLKQQRRFLQLTRQDAHRLQAAISHEIQTPLSAIGELIELTIQRNHQGQPTATLLETSLDATRKLHMLLEDWITQSQLALGHLLLRPAPTNLPELATALSKIYRPLALQKQLSFQLDIQCSEPDLLLDGLRLRQVLSNLLSNALKFTQHGAITLRIRSRPAEPGSSQLQIDVHDTGIGMSTAQANAQGQHSSLAGHGLGLDLSQQLISLMGGKLQINSNPGQGSCISVQLKLAIAQTQNRQTPSRFYGITAMVIEDEPANRELLKQQLESLGLSVSLHDNGTSALQSWFSQPVELVFCDMHLPDLDGNHLCQLIRLQEKRDKRQPCHIIGISADPLQALDPALINARLEKPSNTSKLRTLLAHYTPASSNPVDQQLIQHIVRQDSALKRQFIETVILSIETERQLLLDGTPDNSSTAEALHRLLGIARLLCNDGISLRCQQLEQALHRKLHDRYRQLLPTVLQDLDQVLVALRTQLADREPTTLRQPTPAAASRPGPSLA